MNRSLFVIPLLVLLASFLPAALMPPVIEGSTPPSSFAFNFIKPNTAENPSTMDTLTMTGSGSFDTSASSIMASGSFTHRLADGTVVARGTWQATSFVFYMPFVPFPGPLNPGEQGGILHFIATFFPDGGTPTSGLPVTFTCKIGAPTGTKDGVTVGDFTTMISGFTLFHVNQ